MAISWIAFAFIFAGALLGMLLRAILPEPHLSWFKSETSPLLVPIER